MKNKEEKNITIHNEVEFATLKHNETLSHQFDKIKMDNLHMKNLNFNLLEIPLLKKLSFTKITFENCILGNLHYMDFSRNDEICLINQNIDNYFINTVHPRSLYFDTNSFYSFDFLSNRGYDKISIKNHKHKGILNTIGKARISNLYLEDIQHYSISDLEFLKDRMNDGKITKIFFNDSEIDAKKIFFIERKLKIEKLIKNNA